MPVTPTFPGVYIEEIPSGVRTITGVATSVLAVVDYFRRGPLNRAVQVLNMADFEREFGGLDGLSEGSYAIQQFFLNGGTNAWIVRVASSSNTNPLAVAEVFIDDAVQVAVSANRAAAAGAAALLVAAASEGTWGNSLRVRVDSNAPVAGEFNLVVTEYATVGGRTTIARQETFRNLSMDSARPNFVNRVVNDPNTGSKLVLVTAGGTTPPLANGTLSAPHATNPTIPANPTITAQVTDGTTTTPNPSVTVPLGLAAGAQPLTAVAPALEAAIRATQPADPVFSGATVDVVGNRLRVLPGPGAPNNRLTFTSTAALDALLFTGGGAAQATTNVSEYTLGTAGVANSAQIFATVGANGLPPNGTALIGDLSSKTGINALEDVDLFNLLALPRTALVGGTGDLTPTEAQAVITVAQAYCERRRAFFIMDTQRGVRDPQAIRNIVSTLPRHRNAAIYYPRVQIPDPLNNFQLRDVGASGTIAGLMSRIDAARGVWKAPAGTEATLRNVSQLDDLLTDGENGTLNPLGINCLRTFPVTGTVAWGARTLEGADQQASEWKYIPVRRLALFLEESLYRGTQWVVFEPNDEPLWAQIRLNIGAFMQNLFRQGAFQGRTPREAYFVKCDAETTTQNDINLGIVNVVVGFAPLKPAEFVIIKIQQLAGQLQV
jgi:hypothetical protein